MPRCCPPTNTSASDGSDVTSTGCLEPCAAGTLRRASRSLTRLYDLHLAAVGLTTTQLSILRTIQRHGGPMPLAQLAVDLVFERTSLYRALSPLRRGRLVIVKTGTDRR